MTQMRDLGVVAFFGPDGTCHTEAKLAAAWNLPLISHVSKYKHVIYTYFCFICVDLETIYKRSNIHPLAHKAASVLIIIINH